MAKLDQTWTVEAHHGGSALAAELHRAMGLSHRQAKGLIDARCVVVNGETATKHGQRLEAGDKVRVAYDPALKYEPIHAPKGALDNAFKTLWEDTHLLFVDKPAGLLTVPAEQGGEPSLADAVADHYRRRGQKHAQLYIVHRLDRFTSGVLVFARTNEALHHLKKLFAMHKLQRTYRAILVGELPENQGTLKGHLIEQAKTLKMRVVDPKRKDTEGAQSAVTHYRVVERLPGHTVVEVELETGRRNQIRVQFADRGFPLLGDHVYGEESELLDRQALHAETLGIRHPVTEEMITVTAPPPADFEAALKALRARTRLARAVAGEKGEVAPAKAAKPEFKSKPDFKKTARDSKEGPRARFGDRGDRPRRDGGRDEARPRGAKPAGKPARKFEDRPRDGAPKPKRFEDRPERPRSAKPARSFEDRPREDRPRPKRFEGQEDRPRASKPNRFEDRAERPRGAKPARSFSERTPEGRPREDRAREPREDRPKRSFDKGPRAGAPARPRAARGAVTGPRGSARPARPGAKPDRDGARPPREGARPARDGARPARDGARPARDGARPMRGGAKPKPSGKPSGPRKPFAKKRG